MINDEKIQIVWDYLVNYGIATKEELQLITNINGFNMESLNSVIYARTGFNDYEQLEENN